MKTKIKRKPYSNMKYGVAGNTLHMQICNAANQLVDSIIDHTDFTLPICLPRSTPERIPTWISTMQRRINRLRIAVNVLNDYVKAYGKSEQSKLLLCEMGNMINLLKHTIRHSSSVYSEYIANKGQQPTFKII